VSVALAAVVTVFVRALGSPNGLQSATSIGSLVAALTPLVLGLVLWARRPPLLALTTSTVEQTDAAQRQLAGQVLSQWRDEIGVRQLDDPSPLAVRWRLTELDVADHAEHVVTYGPSPQFLRRDIRAGRCAVAPCRCHCGDRWACDPQSASDRVDSGRHAAVSARRDRSTTLDAP
jgi:hypothetical protein